MLTRPGISTAVGILGTGSYLPAQAVTNSVVAQRTGVTEEWILRKTGIKTRYYAADGEATSDLAVAAAERAIQAAGITAAELGWIVLATSTPDHPQPATACLVQHRLGAVNAAAFDVNAVCAGFMYALVIGARLLAADPPQRRRYCLVVGADCYSRIVDPADRRTSVLFGDGGGAVVLGGVRDGYGIVGSDLSSEGEQHHLIRVDAGGSRTPASEKTVADGRHYFEMNGRAVRDFVTTRLPVAIQRLLSTNGVDAASVDHFIPHQANAVLLAETLPHLGLPRARTHLTVADHGNTSAASIPMALDDACRGGVFDDGDLLLLAGFGGGMTMGTALVRWDGRLEGSAYQEEV